MFHAVEVIHQVDRCWACRTQYLQRLFKRLARHTMFGQQRQQQACRKPNQRRATHTQRVNVPHQRLCIIGG